MKGLDGKTAIISGGATLIGESCAAVLAGYGVNVVIADINEADGKQAAKRIGAKASFIRTDITSDDDIAALVAATVEAPRPPRFPRQRRLHLSRQRRRDRARRLAEGARRQHRRLGDADAGSAPASQDEQGRDRQFRLDLGPRRPGRPLGLSGLQGGDPAADAQPGARPRAGRHPGQRRLAGLDLEQHHEAADATTTAPRPTSVAAPFHLLRRTGDPVGSRRGRRLPAVGRGELHHRHRHQGRRRLHARSAPSGSIRRSRC